MYRDAFINRLLYLLNLFAASVIFLFFCYDFFLIIIAWECIGLFSFLLVNFYSMRIYTIKAALKTFVFSRFSDMFMFFSFILAINVFNTTDLSLMFLQIPFLSFHYLFFGKISIHFLTIFAFSLSTSGVIKAAQFFFHVWLPDAMEAPTPASALIHSSTLVIAGVFLIIRFAILFEFVLLVNYYLAILGAITLSFSAVSAIFQNDIKKLVAYSTISQIGYLVCGCGFGCYEEVLLYLIIHALNKAFLFILVGYIVHFFNHNTDLRQMGGIYNYSFDISIFLLGVALTLSGAPYSAGFLGKEFLLFQLFKDDFLVYLIRTCWMISFFFTPVYMFLIIFLSFYGIKKGNLSSYSSFWNYNLFNNFKLLINANNILIYKKLYNIIYSDHQFSILTCRTTIYLLFFFFLFFSFFGEILIMFLFNFSSTNEVIVSNFHFYSQNYTIFSIFTLSQNLSNLLMFYIIFFFTSALVFLGNLFYRFYYFYFKNFLIYDVFLFFIFIFFLINKIFLIFLIFIFLLVFLLFKK